MLNTRRTLRFQSNEAAEGVTAGISASDRAVTVQAAVAKDAKALELDSAWSYLPTDRSRGGVLTRAGHAQTGCDLARLAGCEPCLIVEI
ncbi:3,4-dihydroxy-2-butanone-4-phosphate synthase [Vibrio lentus]|nr:3,4-dihydroxy-2-butanone-4-phosphate synthase [Vibrio lentus]